MFPGLSHSLAIYAGLQAAGAALLSLLFLVLWFRFRQPEWKAWSGACAIQAVAAGAGISYLHAGGTAPLAGFLFAELVFALLAVMAVRTTCASARERDGALKQISQELQRLRDKDRKGLESDRLTGLLNQAALASRMDSIEHFHGVVAVCDVDNFKAMNDRFGHLAGDEILRNVGQLLRASVRAEDEAFRWGGDEFVILFLNQEHEMAARRMQEVEQRLRGFQVRGEGQVPILISWGISVSHGGRLRDALDAADREMYAMKRRQANRQGEASAGTPQNAGG